MQSSSLWRLSLAAIAAAGLFSTVPAGTAPADQRVALVDVSQLPNWPYRRGPAADGMAVGDAPLTWSATDNVAWKTDIPGLGHSSPVVWGDFIFLTTAIKTGRGGGQGEHNFDVLALDRKTGKILWQRTAKTAVPHEGVQSQYGSFASNSPVTDGKYVYAFFGSRGMYCYDLKGTLVWSKDFGVQMRMRMAFGEGMGRPRRRQADPGLRSGGRLLHRGARQEHRPEIWRATPTSRRTGRLPSS